MSEITGPTYYVRHPDNSYSVAEPQPCVDQRRIAAYMLLRSDGEVHWDEVECIFTNHGAAMEAAERMNHQDDDGYTFRVLRLFGDTRAFA